MPVIAQGLPETQALLFLDPKAEQRLAKGPVISVPAITLEGDANRALRSACSGCLALDR